MTTCGTCSTVYTSDVPPCPHCGSREVAAEVVEPLVVLAPKASDVPDGTVDEVLAWVGDDPEKAAAALEVEQGKDKPRATLVASLTEQLGGDAPA